MSARTGIEWTDTTWNPVTGCTKVSPGCKNCYAERITERFGRQKFTDVVLHPDRLDAPLRWRKPRRVFVNSMSDLFHEEIDFEFIAAVFGVMARASTHTFQVLTKRPKQMRQWLKWINAEGTPSLCCASKLLDAEREHVGDGGPIHCTWGPMPDAPWPLPNVWLGVSCEDQERADERIPLLLQTPAAVRFVSAEPLLGPIDFMRKVELAASGLRHYMVDQLDWIIVGGESGPGARPMDLAWARSIVEQCKAADVPCFVKQLGRSWAYSWSPAGDLKGGNPSVWPKELRVREYPR
jgi:protein gp37